jgi:hypothetical protein
MAIATVLCSFNLTACAIAAVYRGQPDYVGWVDIFGGMLVLVGFLVGSVSGVLGIIVFFRSDKPKLSIPMFAIFLLTLATDILTFFPPPK